MVATKNNPSSPLVPAPHEVLLDIMERYGKSEEDFSGLFSKDVVRKILDGVYIPDYSQTSRLVNHWHLSPLDEFELRLSQGEVYTAPPEKSTVMTLILHGLRDRELSESARFQLELYLHAAASVVLDDMRTRSGRNS